MERDTRVTATDDTRPQGHELGVVPTIEAAHTFGESSLVQFALDLGDIKRERMLRSWKDIPDTPRYNEVIDWENNSDVQPTGCGRSGWRRCSTPRHAN